MRLGAAWISLLVLLLSVPALANADDETDTPKVNGTTSQGGLVAQALDDTDERKRKPARIKGSASGRVDRGDRTAGPRIVPSTGACTGGRVKALIGDASVGDIEFCTGPDPVPAAPALTLGDVRRAFAELKLPGSKLTVQPPDGLTLVNFETNFYTADTATISRTVALLGQQVTIEATPSQFIWSFGDGQSMATTIPGRPYPKLDITHNYLRKGSYQVSLDTTYAGRFRVGGGGWRQIPGTVTIGGAAQPLRAIEAQPKLVGY